MAGIIFSNCRLVGNLAHLLTQVGAHTAIHDRDQEDDARPLGPDAAPQTEYDQTLVFGDDLDSAGQQHQCDNNHTSDQTGDEATRGG